MHAPSSSQAWLYSGLSARLVPFFARLDSRLDVISSRLHSVRHVCPPLLQSSLPVAMTEPNGHTVCEPLRSISSGSASHPASPARSSGPKRFPPATSPYISSSTIRVQNIIRCCLLEWSASAPRRAATPSFLALMASAMKSLPRCRATWLVEKYSDEQRVAHAASIARTLRRRQICNVADCHLL